MRRAEIDEKRARKRKIPAGAGISDEALYRNRTDDLFLTMEALYRLS
jgi:hypothetical protein